jgi:hypothetical protein
MAQGHSLVSPFGLATDRKRTVRILLVTSLHDCLTQSNESNKLFSKLENTFLPIIKVQMLVVLRLIL